MFLLYLSSEFLFRPLVIYPLSSPHPPPYPSSSLSQSPPPSPRLPFSLSLNSDATVTARAAAVGIASSIWDLGSSFLYRCVSGRLMFFFLSFSLQKILVYRFFLCTDDFFFFFILVVFIGISSGHHLLIKF